MSVNDAKWVLEIWVIHSKVTGSLFRFYLGSFSCWVPKVGGEPHLGGILGGSQQDVIISYSILKKQRNKFFFFFSVNPTSSGVGRFLLKVR